MTERKIRDCAISLICYYTSCCECELKINGTHSCVYRCDEMTTKELVGIADKEYSRKAKKYGSEFTSNMKKEWEIISALRKATVL